jgi:hypothetical protein
MKKIILLLLFISLIACRKEFYYNFELITQVNVSCFIKANDTVKLRLSYLVGDTLIGNILAEKDYITNADVYLYEDNIFKEKLIHKEVQYINFIKKGCYFSQNFIPAEEHHYQLKIFVPGYDTLYAETYIPKAIAIDSVLINGEKSHDTIYYKGETNYNIGICFKDDKDIVNYYNYFSSTYFISYDPIIEARYSNSEYFNSMYFRYTFISDEIFNGENYILSTQIAMFPDNFNYYPNMPVVFKLYSLSYDTYAFYKSAYLYQKNLDNPFSEPVIIYSNIKNGIGIFAGMSVSVDSILITSLENN